jgi:hypothetical protein
MLAPAPALAGAFLFISGLDERMDMRVNPQQPSPMAFDKYRSIVPVDLPDRTWPDRRLTKAPRWCSVDLRDGNQALIDPMDLERKNVMFTQLVEMVFYFFYFCFSL